MRCTASTPSPSVTPATAMSEEMEHEAIQTLSPMARCRRLARFLPSCAEMTLRFPSELSESTSVPDEGGNSREAISMQSEQTIRTEREQSERTMAMEIRILSSSVRGEDGPRT